MSFNWQELIKLNILLLFDIYLLITFIASILIRLRQYRSIFNLVRKVPSRWPKLFDVMRQERTLYLNWYTLMPVLGALAVMLIHSGLVRFVWSSAQVTPESLSRFVPAVIWVVLSALLMIGMDLYMIFSLRRLDVPTIEGELDRAEYWLKSKVGSVVKVVTLGFVNPKNIVKTEIRKAIATALQSMDRVIWLWLLQLGLRFLFGFSLWFIWFWLLRSNQ